MHLFTGSIDALVDEGYWNRRFRST